MLYPTPYTLSPQPHNIRVLSRERVCTIILLNKQTLTDPIFKLGTTQKRPVENFILSADIHSS